MYPEKEQPQSDHKAIAEKMGQQIVADFEPDQQNEMIVLIKNIVTESRNVEIKKTQHRLDYLKETLKSL